MKLNKVDAVVISLKHLPIESTQTVLKERFNVKRSINFLYKRRSELKELAIPIMFEEAKHFPDKHLTRLSTIQWLIEDSFRDLKKGTTPIIRQHIRDSIAALQYDMASFDEATKGMIENKPITPKIEGRITNE